MKITIKLPTASYDILIEAGVLNRIHKHANLNRKVMIITDQGVPETYAKTLQAQCSEAYIARVIQGEGAKSFEVYQSLCAELLAKNFHRKDLVIALGGGVVGDLAGFVAATYMRGLDFINIPTTTLAQIDSSIGGKTAINLNGVKNIVGAFYQPQAVFIDQETLNTLEPRHFANGLSEAVKAGMIYDPTLFEILEQEDAKKQIENIVYRSLLVKKAVVEQDEREVGLRQILNFGHTLGHGIESYYNLEDVLHGEAVAVGMMLMLEDPSLKQRLQQLLAKLNLPSKLEYDPETVFDLVSHDKKASGNSITIVKVPNLGEAKLEKMAIQDLKNYLKQN